MAVGDVVTGVSSVAATTGTLDLKPSAGVEWVVHNIYYGAGTTIEFYKTDGTNSVKFDSDTSAGARMGVMFHVTNTVWIQIKNTSAGAVIVGYDGIQTK